MSGLDLNERAWQLADSMVERASQLRIASSLLPSGTRLLDAGIEAAGGLGAGLALAQLCTSGLADIGLTWLRIGPDSYPGVRIWTDHPALACMASQYAGWSIQVGKYFAMASGPLRALARVETELFAKLGYADQASRGVLVLEGRTPPTDEVANYIAARARLDPRQITIAIAPTASLAGGVQIVSRILETALHKMESLGFDVRRVVSGVGVAPLPPVANDDIHAIGRTNDCVLYGGQAHFTVRADDDELAQLSSKLPASASHDYGTPFYDIFKRYGGDFYKIDKMLFSPGEVWLTSDTSGRTFHGGKLDPDILRTSLMS